MSERTMSNEEPCDAPEQSEDWDDQWEPWIDPTPLEYLSCSVGGALIELIRRGVQLDDTNNDYIAYSMLHPLQDFLGYAPTGMDKNVKVARIADHVVELHQACFANYKGILRVTFSLHSKLEYFGGGFMGSQLVEIDIPQGVRELPDDCFRGCKKLMLVNFHPGSKLEKIGKRAFSCSGIEVMDIPRSVTELCERCFHKCQRLTYVIFGEDSKVERIGVSAFRGAGIHTLEIPDSVREICTKGFRRCANLSRVAFGQSSRLEKIGKMAFSRTKISRVALPDGVRELGVSCFADCRQLWFFYIRESSSLESIGDSCFCNSHVTEILVPSTVTSIGSGISTLQPSRIIVADNPCFVMDDIFLIQKDVLLGFHRYGRLGQICIPDYVREIHEGSFTFCLDLTEVIFGKASRLEKIGARAFRRTGIRKLELPESVTTIDTACFADTPIAPVMFAPSIQIPQFARQVFFHTTLREVDIPDCVYDLDDDCFRCCEILAYVRFGASSKLKRIGDRALARTGLREIAIPDTVHTIGVAAFAICQDLRVVAFTPSSQIIRILRAAFTLVEISYDDWPEQARKALNTEEISLEILEDLGFILPDLLG